ncbi:MAG: hypothetical protein JW828_03090 [Sedimentisphaerales bacterium]|nr:hypothetical protein [Sedimentisphaerales bacterium]
MENGPEYSENSVLPDRPLPREIRTAIEHGIDVSMIADNLKRSVVERIRRHQIALDTFQKLQAAGKREETVS